MDTTLLLKCTAGEARGLEDTRCRAHAKIIDRIERPNAFEEEKLHFRSSCGAWRL
jgi:hypothetical protein